MQLAFHPWIKREEGGKRGEGGRGGGEGGSTLPLTSPWTDPSFWWKRRRGRRKERRREREEFNRARYFDKEGKEPRRKKGWDKGKGLPSPFLPFSFFLFFFLLS